jgi:hypothetical protein
VKVLIYKRTHTGDPTPEGVFGLSDCMGRVRAREYEAVIGVGGQARSHKRAALPGESLGLAWAPGAASTSR